MEFNLLNELKDKIIHTIEIVLFANGNKNLKIELVDFRFQAGKDFTYNGIEIDLLDKNTNEKVCNIVFNNVNGEHITISKRFSNKEAIIIREPIKMSDFKFALSGFLK
ncbi:hypothetical protein [Campylobacter sp. JMF_03 NE3]|uniref:hypothetical protein n=1 Tax=Campylobacter sp. JMF_03 NE3 TaxID=2983831 RepID=UPI0022E9ECAB|nr:hypothetical protein [Campylobacter sp. JMF_03 NE3]MDA3053497.1 hypothetical protein [Campylobacter sp. JMF_03 NE3]